MVVFHGMDGFTKFSPADVERITGVSVTKQRDWRRHGFLKSKSKGWNEFHPFDLAMIYLMQVLARHNIGPSRSMQFVEWPAYALLWRALTHIQAYGGCTEDLDENYLEGHASAWVQDVTRVIPSGVFWVIWADGETSSVDDLNKAFCESPQRQIGPVIVLDVEMLAADFLVKVARPLVFLKK